MADTVLVAPRRRGASLSSSEGEGGAALREMWLDATVSESESLTVDWTEHPIESGASVTDHAVVRQPELSLEGVITRTPLWMSAEADNVDPAHLDTQLDALRGMLADREPILIVTGLRAYEGYRMTSLTISRAAGDGQSVKVSMALKPMQIVEAGTVLLPPLPVKPAKASAAKPGEDGGTQTTTDGSGPLDKSLLKGFLDKTGASDVAGI